MDIIGLIGQDRFHQHHQEKRNVAFLGFYTHENLENKRGDKMNFGDSIKNIEEKLGKENYAKISNEIADLLAYEKSTNDSIKQKDDTISRLQSDKEMLITANGNLMQKIPREKETEEIKQEEEKKPFNFRSVFDENGRLK
jgi:uncharacterized FAD-dependent dehydrogenase